MLCIGVLSFHAGLTLAGGWAFRDVAVACVGILVGALATTLLMLAPVRTEWSVAQVRVTRRGWPRLARSLQRPAAAELLNDADGTRVRIRNLAGQALEVRFARLAEARAFEREATSVIRSLHPD